MKNNITQLELFDSGESIQRKKRSLFFSGDVKLEKNIILIISYAIIAIIFFSLGIEKGKGLNSSNMKKTEEGLYNNKETTDTRQIPVAQPESITTAVNKEKIAESSIVIQNNKTQEKLLNYTIQLASFKKIEYAQKEAERISKKGYKTFTMNKGEHIIVCLGKFSSKQEINDSSELKFVKQIYKDYIIRKL